jgi:hypothetical protein
MDVQVGDDSTLFRPIQTVETENAKGTLVSIRVGRRTSIATSN